MAFLFTKVYSLITIIFRRCIDLFERVTKREKQIFNLLLHSPDGFNGQVWATLKPKFSSRSTTWVEGAQALGTSYATFLRPLEENWIRSDVARHILVPMWNAGISSGSSNHYAITASKPRFLKNNYNWGCRDKYMQLLDEFVGVGGGKISDIK